VALHLNLETEPRSSRTRTQAGKSRTRDRTSEEAPDRRGHGEKASGIGVEVRALGVRV